MLDGADGALKTIRTGNIDLRPPSMERGSRPPFHSRRANPSSCLALPKEPT